MEFLDPEPGARVVHNWCMARLKSWRTYDKRLQWVTLHNFSTTRKRAKNSVILGVAPKACPQASGTITPSQRPEKRAAGDAPISLGVLALLRVVVITSWRATTSGACSGSIPR